APIIVAAVPHESRAIVAVNHLTRRGRASYFGQRAPSPKTCSSRLRSAVTPANVRRRRLLRDVREGVRRRATREARRPRTPLFVSAPLDDKRRLVHSEADELTTEMAYHLDGANEDGQVQTVRRHVTHPAGTRRY